MVKAKWKFNCVIIDINTISALKTTLTRPDAQAEPAQELVYCQVNDGFRP